MKKPATRTEIARRQKTSRTTVYRAIKYLETRGKFVEPRKSVGKPVRYRYMKEETMKSGTYKHFRREYYNTPNRVSVMYLLATKKPDVVMLQAWFHVRVVKVDTGKKEVIFDGIGSGISIPIARKDFDYDDKYAELKRFAIASCQVLFETKEVNISMKLATHPVTKMPRLNTIIYYSR